MTPFPRADFPFLESNSYLNTAAESLPPPSVRAALEEYGHHKSLGMRGRDFHFGRLEACREAAAGLLGLAPSEVAFCSCSSEAYNLLASALDLRPEAGDEVVVSDLDFPAGATPWLAGRSRPAVRLWRNRDGVLDPADLEPCLGPRTRLVQLSQVSFYNGHRLDWAGVRDRVRALAPDAVLAVDITQGFGRVEPDCRDADILISSTHKWILGVHGGCVVGVPERMAARLTTRAGGWYHLVNAFDADRFERAEPKPGAASFAVGMPNFAAIYALEAAMRYVAAVGVERVAAHADPLVARVQAGLRGLGLVPLAPEQPDRPSGIVAFRHPQGENLHAALLRDGVHVMHQAGRLRVAVHGYNDASDIDRLLGALEGAVR
jgi:selenocysteine lyase/cysteine desulfurase